jgi:anti-sigma factor ChrR (cupin superfamily)
MNQGFTSDELSALDFALLDEAAAGSLEPVEPPAGVRAAVMAAIRNVPGSHESLTIRAEEGRWTVVAPGARTKKLAKGDGRFTFLLEMEPNAVVPEHDHEGGEDSYVIRGSCHIGSLGLAQGDFHHADASAHHGDVVASAEGCLLLITLQIAA